jgi:Copper type II ascorbate-dependent monooxygenase, C-terminal domain
MKSLRILSALLMIPATVVALDSAHAVTATQSFTATMSKAYQPVSANGGTDDYHCFVIDPHVTTNSIITSVTFKPQQKLIVHHMILFQVTGKDRASALALDNNGAGWSCFGGTGMGSSFSSFLTTPWLSSWAPGRNTDVMPAGYGTSIAKGDLLVIQIHYNLLAIDFGSVPKDRSSVVLNTVPAAGSNLKPLYADLFPAPVELACPAGVTGDLCDRGKSLIDLARRTSSASALEAAGLDLICGQSAFNPTPSNTSTCDRKITQNEVVIKATPHMHLLGRSMKLILNPGTPGEKVLLDRPHYNFDDQSPTILSKPVALKIGDTVRVQCTFDPTLRAILPQFKKVAPRYVTWGEGSSDEMCLGVLGVSHN